MPRKHSYLAYEHKGIESTLHISGPASVFQDAAAHLDQATMNHADLCGYLSFEPPGHLPTPRKMRTAKDGSVSLLWKWDSDNPFLVSFARRVSLAHPELDVTIARHTPHFAVEMTLRNGCGERIETSVVDYQILESTKAAGRQGEVIRRQTRVSPDLSELVKEEVFTNTGHFAIVKEDRGTFEKIEEKSYSFMSSHRP